MLEGAETVYHNQSGQLNVIAEIMLPNQSDYYDPKIAATHNSVRLVVENYSTFDNNMVSQDSHNSSKIISQNLIKVANKRLGAIAAACPDFDLKIWDRNATLGGSPANQIFLDYTYGNKAKHATEIWSLHDNKVYILEFGAEDKFYDAYLPLVKKIVDSFKFM